MARSLEQIERALALSMEGQDPSVDTVKGPVFDLFIRPEAIQVRNLELLYDDLRRRYSLDYVLSRGPEVVQLYGANHGLRRSPGRAAVGNVVFFAYSSVDADSSLTIPSGTLVSTSDSRISFRTTRDAFILGSSLSSFYNASTRRYEIRVPVVALGSGQDFEVPPRRIRFIRSIVKGIDGVINMTRMTNSTDDETLEHFGTRIRSKFNGLGLGSGDGFNQLIQQFDPSLILDSHLVYSTDELFRRRTRRAAWDVYLLGTSPDTSEAVFIGNGVRRTFALPLSPVLNIDSVKVGTVATGFTLIKDTTDQFSSSSRANDQVELSTIPGVNDTVTVSYSYDKLIVDTQEYADRVGIQLYRSDILVRKAIPVQVRVRVLVQVLSSFDPTEAASAAFATCVEFVNQSKFSKIISPNVLRDKLASDVAGVSSISILEFTRNLTGTLPVETIEMNENEYADTPDSLITVDISR